MQVALPSPRHRQPKPLYLTFPSRKYLPASIFQIVLDILHDDGALGTIACVQRCSKALYTITTPPLYRTLTLTEDIVDKLFDPFVNGLDGESGLLLFQPITQADKDGLGFSLMPRGGDVALPSIDYPDADEPRYMGLRVNSACVKRIVIAWEVDWLDWEDDEQEDLRTFDSLTDMFKKWTRQEWFQNVNALCFESDVYENVNESSWRLGPITELVAKSCTPQFACTHQDPGTRASYILKHFPTIHTMIIHQVGEFPAHISTSTLPNLRISCPITRSDDFLSAITGNTCYVLVKSENSDESRIKEWELYPGDLTKKQIKRLCGMADNKLPEQLAFSVNYCDDLVLRIIHGDRAKRAPPCQACQNPV
ncbi:hypothetical protein CI109_101318 [Kwoniella shandongensis]|uniref:Uncharacterized protein n=1 Tax=Kwoniella shandongensis TaxID=1734106 RepID=A0A5M6BU11_9TREE|nr:uncharacterized protein CI109_005302 [Kwoniella shandongensis]KAA5526346.1 hypothetical protein CI109_005302 [Kwoniella shandongensis]